MFICFLCLMPNPQPPSETNQKQLHDAQDHKLDDLRQAAIDGGIQDGTIGL